MSEKYSLLIDEDSLGVDRYLSELERDIVKVGEPTDLPLGSDDAVVAKYAKVHHCIVITRDDKLVKQCKFHDVKFITLGMDDLAKKIIHVISDLQE